jgi:hypothetical protein
VRKIKVKFLQPPPPPPNKFNIRISRPRAFRKKWKLSEAAADYLIGLHLYM